MAKQTVRTWTPSEDADIAHIRGAIDSWDRTGQPSTRPPRDYAAIEAAVDRITKRVKTTRKVTVTETVTEYVDVEDAGEPAVPVTRELAPHHQVEDLAAVAEPAKPKKLGFFARRKQAKAAKPEPGVPAADAPARELEPVPVAAAPRTVTIADDDAWDPGTAAPVPAPKPLQSKAAKRTAAKKAGKKKR